MTEKELAAIVEAEQRRPEASHKEVMEHHEKFLKLHQEFMNLAEQIEREYKKRPCQTGTLTKAGNP